VISHHKKYVLLKRLNSKQAKREPISAFIYRIFLFPSMWHLVCKDVNTNLTKGKFYEK